MSISRRNFLHAALSIGVGSSLTSILKAQNNNLTMGVSNSLLRMNGFTNPDTALAQMQPLADIFLSQGGNKINFQFGEVMDLGKAVADEKTHMAVVPGIEFAWIQQKHPKVEAMALACKASVELKAYVLIPQDSKLARFNELKGSRLAVARKTPHHCQVFLHNQITVCGQKPDSFFKGELVSDIEAAIDGTVDKEYQAVIVDKSAWEVYSDSKPGRARRLKVMVESPAFPTAAIIHKPGVIPVATLDSIRTGLLTAHQKPFTRQLLTIWKLNQFVAPTPQYSQLCESIIKQVPSPIELVSFTNK